MADLLSYGEEEISRLFPKCRLPNSASCADVSGHQRDLIDLSEPGTGSPQRRASHSGAPVARGAPSSRDRTGVATRRAVMSGSVSMEQIRRGGSCEPPGDDSDSSSGRVPPRRDSRIELAGGRELYSQSRGRPGKRRTSASARTDLRPTGEPAVKPAPAETPDSLHLAILGFQPLRETSLVGPDALAAGDANFGVGETPVVDGPVMFDGSAARTMAALSGTENGGVTEDHGISGERVMYGGGASPVTVTLNSAAGRNGERGDQAQRGTGRLIGSVPIADYEGSPRRYGPKPAKPGPGFPQRVWQESMSEPSQHRVERVQDTSWSCTEQNVNATTTTNTSAAPEDAGRHYFLPSCVRGLAAQTVAEPSDVRGLAAHTVAGPSGVWGLSAQTVADVDSGSGLVPAPGDGAPASCAVSDASVPSEAPVSECRLSPPDLAVGCDAAATAGCDATAGAGVSRNFTLSPETTECDSGEVESDLSDGGSVPSSGGRLCAAMPVLEDGLSDGAESEEDELPPAEDPTTELIRQHLSQLEAASARQRAPLPPPTVPVSQSLLPNTDALYAPQQYRPQTVMLSQSLLQRQPACPPVLSAPLPPPPVLSAPLPPPPPLPPPLLQADPDTGAPSRQLPLPEQQHQQHSNRCGNGDIDLRTLDPLGCVRASPPPPPAPGSASGSPTPSSVHQAARRAAPLASPGHQPPEAVQAAIQDIRQTLRRTRTLPLRSPPCVGDTEQTEHPERPIWIPRRSGYQKLSTHCDDPTGSSRPEHEEGADTDQETDRLLGQQRSTQRSTAAGSTADDAATRCDHDQERDAVKKKGRSKEVMVHEPAVLIEGVLFRARYLGSTQLVCEGQPTKATRMMQAEEAVSRIKVPDGEAQPSTDVDLFISTEKIMVLNTDLKEIMMDHALRTISYIADIGELVVLMARRRLPPEIAGDIQTLPKMICHVFESDEAQFIAQSIGQAFQVAYMEFLKANGIEDHSFVKEMDYQEVLNSQEIFGEELKMFAKKELQKEVVVPKQKGEILGVVIVESGWGSLVPTVVIANLAPSGAAARCGLLNIGDQIIAINGISLVGLPLAACQTYVKNAKPATVVKLTVVPCPPVVEVKIRRPDTKYQLGFSVQNGVICSLLRGGIAERGGVRVGHRIIEINSQSVVAVPHDRIVSLLATSVGEIHMKTMPTSLFRLLTGQESPVYI